MGFAKLAIEHGYTIIPVASYGSKDMLDILFDVPLASVLGREMYLPVPNASQIQRMYFGFGKPISTEECKGDSENLEYCKKERNQCKQAIEEQLAMLSEKQQADPLSKRFPQGFKIPKIFQN